MQIKERKTKESQSEKIGYSKNSRYQGKKANKLQIKIIFEKINETDNTLEWTYKKKKY